MVADPVSRWRRIAGALALLLVAAVAFFAGAWVQSWRARADTCRTIIAMQAVYADAQTDVGRDAYAAWVKLGDQIDCGRMEDHERS